MNDIGDRQAGGCANPPRWWQARRGLVVALLASIALHVALTLVPERVPDDPESTPLTATLRELPPPPLPAPAPAPAPAPKPKPKPRPRAPVATPPPPPVASAPAPAAVAEAPVDASAAAPAVPASRSAPAPASEPGLPVLAEDVPPEEPPLEGKTLPPRVDLAYKVFYGTQGFLIGVATYRFEHADSRYRIGIIGDARGLAALLFRGQGRVESRGVITPDGLQPHELVVDKFNRRGSERARFDWENGIANLHGDKTAPLELPTFDLLALMWQFYFQPPRSDVQTFALATTKRIYKVTATRKRFETIDWRDGPVDTEVWHRTSADGRTEGYVWLAPSLRYLPVKVRAETPRGVVEVLLDRIRVDESYAGDLDAAPLEAPDWKDEAAAEQYEDPFARYELTR